MKKATTKQKSSPSKIKNNKIDDTALISVLETLPVGIIIYSLKQIKFANAAAITLLNFDKKIVKDLSNYSVFDFLLPEHHKTIRDNAKQLLKGEAVIPRIYKLKNQKNQIFDIEVKSNIITLNGEQVIQAVFSNVTERIKIEEKLIETENTFKLLTKNSSDIIFLYNYFPKEHYSYVSESVQSILGYSPTDFYKNASFIKNIIVDVPQNKPSKKSLPKKSVRKFKKKDGTFVWLETRYSLLKGVDGKAITLVGISRDVTNELNIENQRKESEEKFKVINQYSNDIIYFFTYQPNPKYLYVSPSIKKILGYSEKDFYANPNLCNSIAIEKKAYRKIETRLAKEQKSGTLKRSTGEFQYVAKSGKIVWLKDDYTPIYDENGKVTYILGISRDITKEKTYELELEQKWNDYKNLIENSPIGIFIHEAGTCLYCNKTAANYLEEKDPRKLVGKNLISFIAPEQQERGIKRLKQAAAGVELMDLAYQIITTKNNIIDVELKTVPIIFKGKSCVQTIVYNVSAEKKLVKETFRAEVAEDLNKQLIDEIKFRKRVQKELVTQTSKYEAIFNNTAHLIATVNKDLAITSFNKNYSDYIKKVFNHQIKIGEVLFNISSDTEQNLSLPLWQTKLLQLFEKENVATSDFFEVQNFDVNKNDYYREIYLHSLKNSAGEVEEVAIIAHDITERKKSEQKIQEQSAKLSAIFDSGDQLMWTLNKKHSLTSFNQNFSDAMFKLYGVRPDIEDKGPFNPSQEINNSHHNWWLEKYDEVFNTAKSIKFTVEQIDKQNKKYFRQVFINPIKKDDKVEEVSCISYDITELKYLQSESMKLEQKLTSIFESSSHLIWTVDKKFEITSYNQNFAQVFEEKYKQTLILNSKPSDLLKGKAQTEYINYWHNLYEQGLQGKKLKFERKEIDPSGEVNYREVYINPIKNSAGEIIELACLAHDITENKNAETKILNQSAKLKAIFESGNQLMWTINKNLELTSFNKNYANAIYSLYGFFPIENKNIRELSGDKTKPFESIWDEKYNMAFQGAQVEFNTERTMLNGKVVHRQYFLYPIKNSKGEVEEVSGLGFDVTDNKLNEGKIIQSLKEKEILLKEVHHRVKNNMQVISSILNLQSSYVKDPYALNLLKECQNRIKTMAFIHESLYQTKNFESVNFSEYVTTLSKNLIHSYSINSQKIKLILTLDKLFLNLDTSIPCGLIINEIISNSLKYAFPNHRDGIIFVNLSTNKNKVTIEAGDNGVGIPESLNIKETQTLGLQLVDTLIEQIGGSLTLDRTKGTKFIIEFKI